MNLILFCFVQNVKDQEILNKLANRLKELRNEKGMTQEDLSFKADLTLSQIARIETGRINTSISTLSRISTALGVNLKELLDF